MISEEMEQLKSKGGTFPVIFFMVPSVIIYIMMGRMVENQRTQIRVLKAVGFTNIQVLAYYMNYSAMIAFIGSFIGSILLIAVLYNIATINIFERKRELATLKFENIQVEDVKDGAPNYLKDGYIAVIEQAVILRDSVMREIEKQQALASIDEIILEKLVDENSIGVTGTAAFLIGDIKSLELEGNILSLSI